MAIIRYPAVAGAFYPADYKVLRGTIDDFLRQAAEHASLTPPKAIIAPHAGYIYSGPIAASAYACLKQVSDKIKRVVIVAPAHSYPVEGIALTRADFYATPFGQVPVDCEFHDKLSTMYYVKVIEEAFSAEHAIEVHLPFLQVLLRAFTLVPLLVGNASVAQVTTVLEQLWGDEQTLIIISSDLSHYSSYEEAKILDAKAAAAILALNPSALKPEMACGYMPIRGLLNIAASKGLQVVKVDLRNSGDTAGTKDEVVGYGAFHFKQM